MHPVSSARGTLRYRKTRSPKRMRSTRSATIVRIDDPPGKGTACTRHSACDRLRTYPQVPPKVAYRLTLWGQSLCPTLDAILKWDDRRPAERRENRGFKRKAECLLGVPGVVVVYLGLIAAFLGGVSLLRPLSFLTIRTRRQATVVLALSLVVVVLG